MACQKMDIIMLQSMSIVVSERYRRLGLFPRHYYGIQNSIYPRKDFSGQTPKLDLTSCRKSSYSSQRRWKITFALNTDGFTSDNDQSNNLNRDNSILGGTRLGRIVGAGGKELLSKLNSARKKFPHESVSTASGLLHG